MSDGMSDGHKMELETRERDKKLSVFGRDSCFYCGGELQGGSFRSEKYDYDVHRHLSWHENLPERIWFCSEQCWQFWEKVKSVLSSLRVILEGSTSAAVRLSVRRSVEKHLSDTRPPHV